MPARNPGAASVALRQYNDGLSQAARVRKAAAGMALGLGLGRFVGGRVDVFPGADSSSLPLLSNELRLVFGDRRMEIAVFLGERDRPNRKPILQVMTEQGEVLGYVKVGWNGVTKRLVANEADALRSLAASPPETFRVPRLLHEGGVGDHHVTVLSPFRHRLLRRGELGAPPPGAALREVAFRQGTETRALAGSEYARMVRDRLADVADVGRRDLLAEAFDGIESVAGEVAMIFGSCHGDWTPWNMTRARSGLIVWDWERSAQPVPVGLDVLHHRFQFAWRGGRVPVERAISAARRESGDMLSWLGVAEPNHELLLRLYLLELILRFEEGRGDGASLRPSADLEVALREGMAPA
ncbi:MAG: hypothetical protein WD027_00040 [Gaiellales bacterium]